MNSFYSNKISVNMLNVLGINLIQTKISYNFIPTGK